MNEKISIIIPAYNVAPYLEECITSVINQTYRNIEILLVDDGSTDDTSKICKAFSKRDERIKFFQQENKGVVAARNVGIRNATGYYLGFVDGDDWIEADMIEKMLHYISGRDLVSIGVFQEKRKYEILNVYDDYKEGSYSGDDELGIIYSSMLYDSKTEKLHRFTQWIWNKLYRTDLVKEIYMYVLEELTFAEDSVFLFHYLLRCQKIYISHQCKYHYRYREGSVIHKKDDFLLQKINKVYKSLTDLFEQYSQYDLLFQLQKWVLVRASYGFSEQMGFDERIFYPEFIANTRGYNDQRIVIYGAGRVGRDAYRQLIELHYNIVGWADKAYSHYQERKLPIIPPNELLYLTFDYVVIAVEKEKIADEIRMELMEIGIGEKEIIWNPPIKLF